MKLKNLTVFARGLYGDLLANEMIMLKWDLLFTVESIQMLALSLVNTLLICFVMLCADPASKDSYHLSKVLISV